MRIHRVQVVALLWTLGSLTAAKGDRVAVPLNDYTRLGQRFTVSLAFEALSVVVPSWLDAEGGLTLTLWDSPQRTTRLGRKVFTNVPDNARVRLHFSKALPAGTYYWEVSDRTGRTRIGLYADRLKTETSDCAYFDGKPNRKRRFVFDTTPAAFPYTDAAEMLAVLKSDAPAAAKITACRQLAARGGPEAIPELADLLADEKLAHLARLALEPMPDPAAGDALRDALPKLKGQLLVGVINSLGRRRDAKAVAALSGLLGNSDPQVASAAAAALGKIATPAAAEILKKALALEF